MLAGRLALKWGIVDVMGWLATMPRGALNFWEAFDMVEPIGEEWAQTALIAHQASMDLYCKAGKTPPDIEAFMPARYKRPKRLDLPKPAKEQFQSLLAMTGFKETVHGDNDQRG
jgi:hypothetical protein